MRHLRDEAGVRGVVFVHDRERAYGPRAMAVLEGLLALARLLEQFGQRAPAPNFPGFTAREVDALCLKCEFRPAALFARLRDRLLSDPKGFVAAMGDLAESLAKYEEEGCLACTGATVQDVRILLGEVRKLRGGT